MLETSLAEEVAFPEALPRPQGNAEIPTAKSALVRKAFAMVLHGTGLLSVAALTILFILLAVPALRSAVAPVVAQVAAPVVAQLEGEARAAEPEPVAPSAASASLKIGEPVSLATADERVAQYLARRYHIADGAVRVLVAEARSAGLRYQVDPLLILSVMAVESSLNPYAQSAVGATGLMQVMPGAHLAEFPSQNARRAALDPIQNVQAGTAILADTIRRGGSVQRGLQLYVGAGNLPDDGGYASHVLAEMARLKLAAQGRIDAALIAAQRTDRGA